MNVQRRVRKYQQPLHSWMVNGGKRAIAIWHRRAGKDEIALSVTCELAHKRVGSYWHCLPQFEQARKAIWTMVNPHTGKRRIDEAFPPEIRESTNDQAMFIRFKNGSTWQLIGSDNYNSVVGAGTCGIVFSEYALSDPSAWSYFLPMLRENNGWAMFITTPRGRNHAWRLLERAKEAPEKWFSQVLTIEDTKALPDEDVQEDIADWIANHGEDVGRARYEQEYLCSFDAAILGAYFGREMTRAQREGRIGVVDIDSAHPVHTAWDLGKAINNPIWAFQVIRDQPRIVDFYRPESDDLADWCAELDKRGYHGTDYVPHDIMTGNWGVGRSRIEMMRSHGRKPAVIPAVAVADRQQAARLTINAAVFDAERCKLGLEGLREYRRDWDDELKTFREHPVKDWAEHIGSAFCYLGMAWRELPKAPAPKPPPKWEWEGKSDGTMVGPRLIDIIERNKKRRLTSARP